MGAPRKYTDKQRAEALRTYIELGPAEASRRHGIAKGTIASWAKRDGLQTSAMQNMREANEFQKQSFAETRHEIITDLYGLAKGIIGQLKSPSEHWTLARNEEGAERAYLPGFIPSQDKQREATTLGIMLDKAERLEKIDSDNGVNAGRSMLEKLAEQLGAMPVVDPDVGESGGGGEPSAAALPADE